MNTFDKVIPYLKKSAGRILLGILMLVIVDAIQLVIPKIMQYAIDHIQNRTITQSGLALVGLAILGLAIGIMVMRFFWRILIIGNSYVIETAMREDYYNHLLRLSQNFFNRSKIGDLMAYATNDLNAVRMLFGMGFIAASDIFLMTFASFGFMVSINLRLTLLAIIPLPLLTLTITTFGKKVHKRFGRVQTSFASLSGAVQESISGIRVVKAFVQEDSELAKIDQSSMNYVKENIGMAKLSGIFHPLMGLIISISMITTLWLGGQATIRGDITIGGFIAFFSYLGMLVWPMIAIGMVVEMYQRGTASLKRLNEIFAEQPEVTDSEADPSITSLKGNIAIKNLSFRYQENLPVVFDQLSLSVEDGKTLAIVGKTGCGKTTLIDLLTRVYNPPYHTVTIDGHWLEHVPLNILHRDMMMVPQDIFLFSDSIANNIRLGKPDATLEEIETAAKMAQVYADIKGFDQGFDTLIGERGVTLSGGQKQRVAIARALLCNPQILILDDALSAVDTKTERGLLHELIEQRQGKTTIIIAHRISSVSHADSIAVIDQHKVAELGSHEELLALNGIYKDLADKQMIQERLEEGQ